MKKLSLEKATRNYKNAGNGKRITDGALGIYITCAQDMFYVISRNS